MSNVLEFLKSVWNKWVTLLTGGTAIALLGLWERYRGAAVRPAFYWIVAFVLFFRACFLAWEQEHKKRLGLELDASDKHSTLHSEIDWVHLARDSANVRGAQIIVIASIVNRGLPSSADKWALAVQLPSGTTFEAQLRKIPPNFVLRLPNESFEFKDADALYAKAMASPIPTGGKIRGLLWFELKDIEADAINQRGTIFSLWFQDSFNRVHPAVCQISQSARSLPAVFPGMHQ